MRRHKKVLISVMLVILTFTLLILYEEPITLFFKQKKPRIPLVVDIPISVIFEPHGYTLHTVDNHGNYYYVENDRVLHRYCAKTREWNRSLFTSTSKIMTVHVTYNNLIFVGLRNGQVYRSVDEGITFTAVHEWSKGGYSLFWSFASDETWILIGEYGAKNDTRRVCASKDDGETWVPVYETPEAEGVHIHCVAIDPYTKGWWVSVGDYPFGRVLYSLDNGTFWQEIACPKTRRKWQPWQPLTILFFEQFILIVNDVFPQVFRMHRKTMVAEYIIDIGDFPNYAPPYSVIVGTYGIYASIVRYPEHTHDAGIFASYDKGYTWYQLVNFSKWAKTIDQSIDPLMIFGAVPIVYADGYIHGTCIVGGHAFQFKDMYYVSDLQNFNRVQNFHLLQKYDTPIMNMLFKNTNSPL